MKRGKDDFFIESVFDEKDYFWGFYTFSQFIKDIYIYENIILFQHFFDTE